jgi:hypothetical protein
MASAEWGDPRPGHWLDTFGRVAAGGTLFALAAFAVGLIAACFVPPEWVVTAEDSAFLHSNPHGVIDLSDDYQQQLDGRPMDSERHLQLSAHLRQLWLGYWLRWGALSIVFGAITLGVRRTFGNRVSSTFLLGSGIGFVLFIGFYLLQHPGFNPLY